MPTVDSGLPDTTRPGPQLDPEHWVAEHGDYLYACAMLRLRDPERAKDAVQETLLAALRSREAYAGRSSEKAWLVGILKHKIHDYFRRTAHEITFTDAESLPEEDVQFSRQGWNQDPWKPECAPVVWHEAGEGLDNAAFWDVLYGCASKLPRKIARAFLLREVDGLGPDEIRSILAISENNLWIMLHRARLSLRLCLQKNWFGPRS